MSAAADLRALGYRECSSCREPVRVRDGFGHAAGCRGEQRRAVASVGYEQRVVEFTVHGKPVVWQRTTETDDGRRVNVAAVRQQERAVAEVAGWSLAGFMFVEGPVELLVTVVLPRPASGRRWPDSSNDGDASNYLKLVEDALNGVAYTDDGQLVDSRCRMRFGDSPCTVVRLARPEDSIAPVVAPGP